MNDLKEILEYEVSYVSYKSRYWNYFKQTFYLCLVCSPIYFFSYYSMAFIGLLVLLKLRRSEKLAHFFLKKLIIHPQTNIVELIYYEKNELKETKILKLDSIKIKFDVISTGKESYHKLYFTSVLRPENEVFGQTEINEWSPELLSDMYMTLKKMKGENPIRPTIYN